jgi:acetyl-CoA carboxylase/biotin carboxylase 1
MWANDTVRRIPSAEILRELSDSRWTVYDVLPTFFRHDDVSIELGMIV